MLADAPEPVQPLIPDFVNTLLLVLEGFGFPIAILVLIATIFGIESWYSNGKRVYKFARKIHKLTGRLTGAVADNQWASLSVAAISTFGAIVALSLLLLASYSSLFFVVGMFDAGERAELKLLGSHPLAMIDLWVLAQILDFSWIILLFAILMTATSLVSVFVSQERTWHFMFFFPLIGIMLVSEWIFIIGLVINLMLNVILLLLGQAGTWGVLKFLVTTGIIPLGIFSAVYMVVATISQFSLASAVRYWSIALSSVPRSRSRLIELPDSSSLLHLRMPYTLGGCGREVVKRATSASALMRVLYIECPLGR
ncbi:hypothetical protein SAMN05216298_0303 [Glycomyces sambucus]|uniref:Uncharacterized protein n=1 Tax=Glycomyces sambucus TaxID=380244 RepID=A0A1G9CF27_9ACTN|nr:hypothetical protein [Glycomyces sambucus]SDK50291.1 hypothetical protein SAMN05216298_0303 [Glycomyces sambucus]